MKGLRSASADRRLNRTLPLFADHKQMAGVLRVNFSVAAQRRRRVGRAQRQLLEDLLLQTSALADRVQVAVLAVGVYYSVRVNRRSIDAPLEAIRVVRNAGYRAVRISRAAQRVGVLEGPLDGKVRAELSHEELLRTCGVSRRPVGRTYRRDVTVRSETTVMIVLDHDRVGPVVLVDSGGNVPPEIERAQIRAVPSKVHQVPLRVVVPRIGAEV